MERYFLRSDKDNFWFVLISDKVESYMYKFTVTENEPPKMYRYVGNEPIDLSTFYELTYYVDGFETDGITSEERKMLNDLLKRKNCGAVTFCDTRHINWQSFIKLYSREL